ncbi:hypothetical protein RFI_13093 [Reticulomyxa filosa]|uniref:RGS domain-containing protein n=1 Tax=Reticulomyxa filosa TaxID=46433 RepID=X6NCM6_RETFI|nr:hypothetical protein RFI_13093 [Reticulomyxa filosa]|eukprot:ETO24065.1 hypothetical protein RFI_13093 [Reticulomyxa filosa]
MTNPYCKQNKLKTKETMQRHSYDKEMNPTKEKISLEKLLTDTAAIDVFMQHLSKEFSLELLLSVIEMTQFQEFVREQILNKEAKAKSSNDGKSQVSKHSSLRTVLERKNIQLPANLPKSVLVYNESQINAYIDSWTRREVRQTISSRLTKSIPLLSEYNAEDRISDHQLLYCKSIAFHLFNKYVRIGSQFST